MPSGRVLVEKTKNILPPWQPVEAALSHTLSQRLKKAFDFDRVAFEQTRNHGQIRQHGRVHHGHFIQREAVQRQRHVVAGGWLDANVS